MVNIAGVMLYIYKTIWGGVRRGGSVWNVMSLRGEDKSY